MFRSRQPPLLVPPLHRLPGDPADRANLGKRPKDFPSPIQFCSHIIHANENRTISNVCQELIVRGTRLTIEPVDTNKEEKLAAFACRLNEALDGIGFPPKGQGRQVDLARLLDVSQKGARKWLEGEAFPTTDKLMVLSALCKRSFEWLATGRENTSVLPSLTGHADSLSAQGQHQQQGQTALSADEQALLDAYRFLDPDDREKWFAPALKHVADLRRYVRKAGRETADHSPHPNTVADLVEQICGTAAPKPSPNAPKE